MAAVLILAAGLAACKKRVPENIPQPKAGDPLGAAAGPADATGPLTAPGERIKAGAGYSGKAGEAKALFERTAGQKMESLDLDNHSGN